MHRGASPHFEVTSYLGNYIYFDRSTGGQENLAFFKVIGTLECRAAPWCGLINLDRSTRVQECFLKINSIRIKHTALLFYCLKSIYISLISRRLHRGASLHSVCSLIPDNMCNALIVKWIQWGVSLRLTTPEAYRTFVLPS